MDKSGLSRCFQSRRSNESQCPMLTTAHTTTSASLTKPSKSSTISCKTPLKTSSLLPSSLKNSPGGAAHGTAVNHHHPPAITTQKKLRFQLAKERKASTTLGIIMSAFTFCWLPFFVLALLRPFLNPSSKTVKTLSSLFLWLGYANSLLNPIIYATLNRDFRKPFQEILYFRCGSLNHMMREEFYHSQYGDPDHHTNTERRCNFDYDEGVVEYIEADGETVKVADVVDESTRGASEAHESFL